MKRTTARLTVTLTGAALSLLLAAAPAVAIGWWGHDNRGNACEETARTMLTACYFDVGDNFRVTKANCLNLADPDARNECLYGAGMAAGEDIAECRDQRDARLDVCELLDEDRYDPDPLLDPAISFVDPDTVTLANQNPYVSIVAGHTYVLRGGEDFEETDVVTVTDGVRDILGVPCRVVLDVVVLEEEDGGEFEYTPVEVTDDWLAQDTTGIVYYCGELARNYADEGEPVLRNLDGSFEAGIEWAKSGELILAAPAAGDAHRQEFALDEAEDVVEYIATAAAPGPDEGGDNPDPAFACAPNRCTKTYEFAALEPFAAEFKYYLPGTGQVLGVELEDGEPTGVRDELVCVGDSLDVLQDPACGIGDPGALLDKLCTLAPEAFCTD